MPGILDRIRGESDDDEPDRLDEPGSDARLLRGLMLKLIVIERILDRQDDDRAKLAAIREAMETRQTE